MKKYNFEKVIFRKKYLLKNLPFGKSAFCKKYLLKNVAFDKCSREKYLLKNECLERYFFGRNNIFRKYFFIVYFSNFVQNVKWVINQIKVCVLPLSLFMQFFVAQKKVGNLWKWLQNKWHSFSSFFHSVYWSVRTVNVW